MKIISDYEIIDHGIENSQYFQGCGTAFSKYENVVTGCGSNPSEAIADALDQISAMDFNVCATLESEVDVGEYLGTTSPNTNPSHEENEDSKMYYYLSIRWN